MNVILEAIQFNHVPDSATVDAFNIRRNETEPVHVPEWRKGISVKPEDSPAAYAIRETRGNVLTIKAKFKSTGPGSATVEVRAVEAREQHRQSLGYGPIGFVLRAFSTARTAPVGNVLGLVRQKQITFNAAGETDFVTFKLSGVRLWSVGVSASTTNWRWQFRAKPSDRWTDFALSSHRIYAVLEVPKAPWEQTPPDETNTQLPWADALEYACDWARGAKDPDEAAKLITRSVNDLGLRLVRYASDPAYAFAKFDCAKFLQLLANGVGNAQTVNCDDCATIVSTFANLLGGELWQSTLGFGFDTNPILLIGPSLFEPTGFSRHAVAWKNECRENDALFDACLQIDGDGKPAISPQTALLSTNLRFGNNQDGLYKFCLVSSSSICNPHPEGGERRRRKIGSSYPGGTVRTNEEFLKFLKAHYDYESWASPKSSSGDFSTTATQLGDLREKVFIGWQLFSFKTLVTDGFSNIIQAVFRAPGDNPNVLLRIDAYECAKGTDPRRFLLALLAEFQLLNLSRLNDPVVGEVVFVQEDASVVLFVRGRFVCLVRSAGRIAVPIIENAHQLDQHLRREATMT